MTLPETRSEQLNHCIQPPDILTQQTLRCSNGTLCCYNLEKNSNVMPFLEDVGYFSKLFGRKGCKYKTELKVSTIEFILNRVKLDSGIFKDLYSFNSQKAMDFSRGVITSLETPELNNVFDCKEYINPVYKICFSEIIRRGCLPLNSGRLETFHTENRLWMFRLFRSTAETPFGVYMKSKLSTDQEFFAFTLTRGVFDCKHPLYSDVNGLISVMSSISVSYPPDVIENCIHLWISVIDDMGTGWDCLPFHMIDYVLQYLRKNESDCVLILKRHNDTTRDWCELLCEHVVQYTKTMGPALLNELIGYIRSSQKCNECMRFVSIMIHSRNDVGDKLIDQIKFETCDAGWYMSYILKDSCFFNCWKNVRCMKDLDRITRGFVYQNAERCCFVNSVFTDEDKCTLGNLLFDKEAGETNMQNHIFKILFYYGMGANIHGHNVFVIDSARTFLFDNALYIRELDPAIIIGILKGDLTGSIRNLVRQYLVQHDNLNAWVAQMPEILEYVVGDESDERVPETVLHSSPKVYKRSLQDIRKRKRDETHYEN